MYGKYRKFACHFTCDVFKYFNIYCGKSQEKGFFLKMLGFDKHSVSDEEEGLVLEYYEKIQEFVTEVENKIARLEHRLTAL